MKKILVPTDFSENALNALEYALAIASVTGSHVTVLHTYTVPRPTGSMASLADILKEDAEKEMSQFLGQLPDGVDVDGKILRGDAVDTISSYAEQSGYDLVVMGTQGASGLKEVFIGSVTGGVMKKTLVAVLAIPAGYRFDGIKKIIFSVDNSKLSEAAVVSPLKALAAYCSSEIMVFHREDESDNNAGLVQTIGWIEDVPHSVTVSFDTDDVNESINAFAKENNADMLCLVRRHQGVLSFFERLFRGSVTESQVFHSDIPLLILHSA